MRLVIRTPALSDGGPIPGKGKMGPIPGVRQLAHPVVYFKSTEPNMRRRDLFEDGTDVTLGVKLASSRYVL